MTLLHDIHCTGDCLGFPLNGMNGAPRTVWAQCTSCFRPQVILLDIGLPDFKGYNIARQLKWEPDLRNTRIIAITGRSMDEVRQKALEAGCEEVFAKPMDPTRLEEILVKH